MTRRSLAALMLALFTPGLARAQGNGNREMTFETPNLANNPVWEVARSDAASGEVRLELTGPGKASMAAFEGYFLLVPTDPKAKSLARVLVQDVDDKSVTFTASPEVVAAFPKGSRTYLIRPFPATTKQLKGIPELVSLEPADNPDEKPPQRAADRARSVNNLKQIGLALHNYVAVNDRLPPAVVRGPDGKAWHSWRVLILPYIEGGALYDEYDFSEPWDSPKNLKLLDKMPSVYRDPIYGDARSHFTNYAVLVGETTPFPPDGMTILDAKTRELKPEGAITFAHVRDGLSNTIAAAGLSPARKIPWTKPEDIAFGDDLPPLGDPKGISAPWDVAGEKLAPVLLLDGSVRVLSAKTQKPALDALITRAGGEIVPAAVFRAIGAGLNAGDRGSVTIVIDGGKATARFR